MLLKNIFGKILLKAKINILLLRPAD
jgi:hypothetical protein